MGNRESDVALGMESTASGRHEAKPSKLASDKSNMPFIDFLEDLPHPRPVQNQIVLCSRSGLARQGRVGGIKRTDIRWIPCSIVVTRWNGTTGSSVRGHMVLIEAVLFHEEHSPASYVWHTALASL